MTKKRKYVTAEKIENSGPVEVVVEDVTSHPLCLHGPTLLFASPKGRYFACSACRNKKDCTVHIEEEEWKKEGVKKRNEKYYSIIPKINKEAAWKNLQEVKLQHPSDRAYCNTCKELYIISKSRKHIKDHKVILSLTNEQLTHPSTVLPPLENDGHEAQYLFSKKAISTVLGILTNNKISNILCIGTPTIHEAAQDHPEFNSLLLDYDTRHHLFHPTNKFLWYNMFNNYLFDGNKDEKILKKFMKQSKNKGLAIVMDPPFGGRVEPLIQTIKELSNLYNTLCETADKILPVIWAFPYFAEPYIKNIMPEIKMHDYQVEYANHKKFGNKNGGRKFGSPVRFFTNLPFSTIDLSNDSSYKLCDKCKFWVSTSNRHCTKCRECTSKNGMTYKHCNICKRCVKPTFVHCEKCERCCQEKGHVCGTIVVSQSCYICNEKGHKKSECPESKGENKKKKHK
ncbi:putative zinc finger CCHC domain containing 4 [Danaus plexippus plexippus]|uniref:Zinc finger CCHC domain containing 4 n=1 Tax=Danaus plexippus plexippus TaxID=278856 RepID=A0A212EV91_DANPL|nr:putative zinc finger CCHC domain containing 4 [Danaus plexippus plexippus]